MFVFVDQTTNGYERSKKNVLFTVLFISYFLPWKDLSPPFVFPFYNYSEIQLSETKKNAL